MCFKCILNIGGTTHLQVYRTFIMIFVMFFSLLNWGPGLAVPWTTYWVGWLSENVTAMLWKKDVCSPWRRRSAASEAAVPGSGLRRRRLRRRRRRQSPSSSGSRWWRGTRWQPWICKFFLKISGLLYKKSFSPKTDSMFFRKSYSLFPKTYLLTEKKSWGKTYFIQ